MAGTLRPTNNASCREPVNQSVTERIEESPPAMRKAILALWNESRRAYTPAAVERGLVVCMVATSDLCSIS